MKLKPIILVLCAFVCLFLGFALGRLSSSSSEAVTSPVASGQELKSPVLSKGSGNVMLTGNPERIATDELEKSPVDQNPAVVQLALTEWCKVDPEGALAFALQNKREDWLYYCLGLYGRSDPDSALSWIDENTVDVALRNSLKTSIYQGWAKDDPTAAVSKVKELPVGPLRDQILQSVVAQWAVSDVSAVFDWIETQEPSLLLSNIYGQAMSQYIEQSPEEALGLVSDLSNNNDKLNFANKAAFELAKKDPRKVLGWIDTLNADQRHAAQMGLMEQWGASPNAKDALDYIKQQPENSQTEELLSMLALKMAYSSPDDLARQLPTLSLNQQKVAASQLARSYGNTTPTEMLPWLNSLESPEVRDVAVVTALSSFRHTNVAQAFDLATSINNYNNKRDEVQKTVVEWMAINPQAAMAALKGSSLSDDLKSAIARNVAAQSPQSVDFLLPAK